MSRRYCKLLVDLLEEEYVRLGGTLYKDFVKLKVEEMSENLRKRKEEYDPNRSAKNQVGFLLRSVIKRKLYPGLSNSHLHPERFEAESRKETGNWIKLFFTTSRTKTIMDLLDKEIAKQKLQKPKDYRKIARIRLIKTKIDPNSEKEFLKLFEESVKKQKATKYKRTKKSKSAIESL